VLDASALLALLNSELGSEIAAEALAGGAAMSAVNLSEVVAKLAEAGMASQVIHAALDPLGIDVRPFDAELAYLAGMLRPLTRTAGLSLGDRVCVALAQSLQLPVVTADRQWDSLDLGVVVRLVR
jgi:PIN domain nuclease of toxin-antitoxin system